jgi:hypothetical protein
VNQVELRFMAQERILDAKALLNGSRWSYAYYVAGYAIECALKSCVLAQMVHTGGVFRNKKFAEECFTHDFNKLVDLAGLSPQLHADLAASAAGGAAFATNWGVAVLWRETSRYEQKTEPEARALYAAITDNSDGVLRWTQNYW